MGVAPRHKRIVVTFVGGWGHVEPLLPVAALASERGHEVSFAGQALIADRLSRLGHRVDVVGPDTLETTPKPLVPVDRAVERTVASDHFVTEFGQYRAAVLAALFERETVDLVVCDEVDVGAVVAAERLAIPCVTVSVIAAGRLFSPATVGTAWNGLRANSGLGPDPDCERMAGTLALGPLPRSFRNPDERCSPQMRFTRPAILDQLTEPDTRRPPTVYVSLGTVFNLESGDLLDRLIVAMNRLVRDESVDVVITTGPHVAANDLPVPRNGVRIEEFVPLRNVLGGCGAVVCHGGSGTVVSALSLGIPVALLPMGADQPDNADRCRDLGVGVVLDPLTASPYEIVEATRAVLRDPELRSNAHALALEAAAQPRMDELPELQPFLDG